MKFVIIDAAQHAYGESKISPKYIEKLKNKYKLETVKIEKYKKEIEYVIITVDNLESLIDLKKLVGEFVIGLNLNLPEKIDSIINSTIVIYDNYIE